VVAIGGKRNIYWQWKRTKASLARYCPALSQALQCQWGIGHGRHPRAQLFTSSDVPSNVFALREIHQM